MKDTRPMVPALVLCVAAAAVMPSTGCRRACSDQPAQGPAQVSTVTIEAHPVALTTELPGRTSAHLVAEIRPQVNGIIKDRPFTEGSDVTAGSLLYKIDPAPYQAAYDQAAAALAVAEAGLPALRSRAERVAGLAEIHAAGQQDADDAAAALRQAEAGVTAAEAALEGARINLSYTPITAPIAGRIGRSAVTLGALVTAYQPLPLAVIQQLDPIYVDATQATAELLRLRRALGSGQLTNGDNGSTVKLILEDGSPYPLPGSLEFRDVTVDPTTGSVTLRMVFPNPDHVLLPGMFVRAIVEEGVNEQGILVPQQGVSRDSKGRPTAWVVNADDTVEQRMLELDRAVGDRWIVVSGLAAGDRVIVEGRQKVRPGQPAQAVPFTAIGAEPSPVQPDPPSSESR